MQNEDLVIDVRHANIYQGEFKVLEDVSFSVEKGEFVYLVGRTGSGKSSLLKTLYADLELNEGEIDVAGYPIHALKKKDIPFLRRRLGIIFQDFQLFNDRSVYDNLNFVLKATGWKNSAKMKHRISDVLMRVGLESSAGKYPLQLSGGEQQRVVIARALLNEPVLLIADEPTGNLDPEIADNIMKIFLEINNGGTAVLMATHNYQLIEQYPARTLRCADQQLNETTSAASM